MTLLNVIFYFVFKIISKRMNVSYLLLTVYLPSLLLKFFCNLWFEIWGQMIEKQLRFATRQKLR